MSPDQIGSAAPYEHTPARQTQTPPSTFLHSRKIATPPAPHRVPRLSSRTGAADPAGLSETASRGGASDASRARTVQEALGPTRGTRTTSSGASSDAVGARVAPAWIGLLPKHSSGGRDRLGSISKQGDRYLRSLFVAGGRAVVRYPQIDQTPSR